MLHAELHGKLGSEATDAERREDILTSTVFGLLFAAGAWDVLFSWLSRAHPVGHAEPLPADASGEQRYWFWPSLHGAEPDLVVRAGLQLVIIEVKYRSGKSGKASAHSPHDARADQLVREWRACAPEADLSTYPAPLAQAIRECHRMLVYLVSRSRWVRERRALEASVAQVPDARMYLLTWEDLDDVLARSEVPAAPWPGELRQLLERRGLALFRGFGELATGIAGAIAQLGAWKLVPSSVSAPLAGAGLNAVFSSASLPMLERLASWGAHRALAAPAVSWAQMMSPASLPRLASLAALAPRFPREKR